MLVIYFVSMETKCNTLTVYISGLEGGWAGLLTCFEEYQPVVQGTLKFTVLKRLVSNLQTSCLNIMKAKIA